MSSQKSMYIIIFGIYHDQPLIYVTQANDLNVLLQKEDHIQTTLAKKAPTLTYQWLVGKMDLLTQTKIIEIVNDTSHGDYHHAHICINLNEFIQKANQTTMSTKQFAHYIITVAHAKEKSITNTQLQKVMYFTLKTILQKKLLPISQIKKLYDEPFLVWKYGPTIKSIYNEYQIYGSTPIAENYDNENFTQFNHPKINQRIIELLDKDVFELIEKSRREKHWQKNQKSLKIGQPAKYQLSDIAATK